MLKKLRLKFICINMFIVSTMLIVIFSLVFHFTRMNLEAESISMLQSAILPTAKPGPPTPGTFSPLQVPNFTLTRTPRGDLMVTGSGHFDLSSEEQLLQLLEKALSTEQQTGVLEEERLRFYISSVPGPQTVIFADISSELSALRSLRSTCIVISLVSFLLFFLLSFLLARWAVKPVEQAWQQQKQFVADASHELKTPLTVIMTNAELLLEPNCPDHRQFTGNILTVARQMRSLTENLLELARADNGSIAASSVLDFSELTADALLPFEPVYFEAGLSLLWEIEPALAVKGSEQHLRQVVDILTDNACKYTPAGGEVLIRLRRHGRHALLSVANPGEAISREDLKRIFKRFYRADKVRTRSGSYGLGLSIAQSIIEAHQGKIWAESSGGINTFFVQLPLA